MNKVLYSDTAFRRLVVTVAFFALITQGFGSVCFCAAMSHGAGDAGCSSCANSSREAVETSCDYRAETSCMSDGSSCCCDGSAKGDELSANNGSRLISNKICDSSKGFCSCKTQFGESRSSSPPTTAPRSYTELTLCEQFGVFSPWFADSVISTGFGQKTDISISGVPSRLRHCVWRC
jgi:hypothetical protein